MSESAVQIALPIVTEAQEQQSGIWPHQWIRHAINRQYVKALEPIEDHQVQPASLDLRLGSRAFRVPASFLPGDQTTVADKVKWLAEERLDLTNGAVLQKGSVYIVELQESLRLKKRISAVANPKSSTGRLDLFARLITDSGTEFDNVQERYQGPLWAEIAPRSFNVLIRKGSRLLQIRIKRGTPPSNDTFLRQLDKDFQIVRGGVGTPNIKDAGIAITVDVMGDEASDVIGYKAKQTEEHIDVDRVNYYEPLEYWEPVYRPKNGGIILAPDDFHILASKERIVVPPQYAADMVAYDTLVGEFRVHYAGFFDPGFGHSDLHVEGTRAVLEVRSHEVPFMVEDGQVVGRLMFERLTEKSEKPYGSGIGSSYQRQGLTLSKHFKRHRGYS